MTGKHIKKRRQEKLRKQRATIKQVKERLGMSRQSFDRIGNPQRNYLTTSLYAMLRMGEKDAKQNT